MNPDQAVDAVVQHDDWSCDGGGDDSLARTLLRQGWDLSRKAALSGAVATAAPIVAPPLLVLSVAGLALSLPFVAYLASLAATDRIMGALLPLPRTQPYQTCDLEDDEFMEVARDEVAAVDSWDETEDGAISEESERYTSQPLLRREPRLSGALVTASGNDEDTVAKGESRFQELGHRSFVLDNGEQGTSNEGYGGYIATEVLPRGFDVSGPMFRDEDNVIERSVETPVPAVESIQQLSVPDTGDKTGGGKSTARKEMESSEEMLSLGFDITELSDFQVPALGNQGIVVQREVESGNSVPKSGQDSHVPDIGDKTEDIPLQDVDISESSAPNNITLQRKTEGDVIVEIVIKEVTMKTTPVTVELANQQMDSIAAAIPESGSLQNSDLVAHKLQEASFVDDVIETTTAEDIVLDMGDTNVEGVEHHGEGGVPVIVTKHTVRDIGDAGTGDMEHHGEVTKDTVRDIGDTGTGDMEHDAKGGVSSVVPLVTLGDVMDLVPSTRTRSTPVSNLIDDMTSVNTRPDDRFNQTTCCPITNKKLREKEVEEEKHMETEENKTKENVPTSSVEQQNVDVSKSPVSGDHTKIEDEVTVQMVPKEMMSAADDLIAGKLVAVQLNIVGSESELLPRTAHMAQELQTMDKAAVVEEIEGSTEMEDIINDISHTEIMDNYTEEQLREQLDTLSTITGYSSPLSSSLEAGLAGLYIFLGVEPPVSSKDASDLDELNAKLWFLKSIIGVE